MHKPIMRQALIALAMLLATAPAPAKDSDPFAAYRISPATTASIKKHGQLAELKSRRQKPIPVYQFGNGQEEFVFFFGVFHGDEQQGKAMIEGLMGELVKDPGLYAHRTIYCIPVVNPDGYAARTRVNAQGVDLNRNFPTRDFRPQGLKTKYYSGPKSLSEPESRLVAGLLAPFAAAPEKYRQNLKIVSIHAPLKGINYDGPAAPLATAMARSIQGQLPVMPDIGYPTPGSFGTYYGKELKFPVITFETPPISGPEAWKKYRPALLEAIRFNPKPAPAKSGAQR